MVQGGAKKAAKKQKSSAASINRNQGKIKKGGRTIAPKKQKLVQAQKMKKKLTSATLAQMEKEIAIKSQSNMKIIKVDTPADPKDAKAKAKK